MRNYFPFGPSTVTTGAQQVIATLEIVDNPRDIQLSAVPTTITLNGFRLQFLPPDVAFAAAAEGDWQTLAKDNDFKPATLGAPVVSSDPVGISALTDGVRGFAHVLLPPTRGIRLLASAASSSGTVKGSIGI